MLRGSGRSAALEGVARGGLAARAPHVGPVLQKDLDLVGRAFPGGDADEILQWARAALVRLQSV